ncbi:MAG TPA: discoidin domain-containing protein, partial [Planctomycetota bacterium]|nr:discoidin domain-containing protein [Planctomycetota bacterium]
NEENLLGGGTTAGPSELVVELETPVMGRFVRVTRLFDDDNSGAGFIANEDEKRVLSVGEVEVFGTLMPDCPEEGEPEFADTTCDLLTASGPIDEGPGLWLFSASGLDDTGDEILYTFKAVSESGLELVSGPSASNLAELFLSAGRWTVSVELDDSRICDDTGPDAICVEEIQVSAPAGANKALLRPSRQSSDFNAGLIAARGNDGDLSTFTATASADDDPFWEVDLLEDVDIRSIVIHNRVDCCQSRLRDITVSIRDRFGDDATVLFETELLNEENVLGGQTTAGPPRLAVNLREIEGGDIEGRYVRVSRLPDPDLSGSGGAGNVDEAAVLSIGEVEVWSESAPAGPFFVRGDPNADDSVNLTDAIFTLGYLFLGTQEPTCIESADTDGSGSLNLTDGIYLLTYLFGGGGPPPAPFPDCGLAPDGLQIGCELSHPRCVR